AASRDRWGRLAVTQRAVSAGTEPESGPTSQAGAKAMDSQARHPGAKAPGHPHDVRPSRSSVGQVGPGTAMGSTVRAQLLRLPTWTIMPGCHRGHFSADPLQAQIRL